MHARRVGGCVFLHVLKISEPLLVRIFSLLAEGEAIIEVICELDIFHLWATDEAMWMVNGTEGRRRWR